MTKEPSVETKIYDILDEINPKIAECVCGNHWTLHRGSNLHKATEQILALFSTQQAQMRDSLKEILDYLDDMQSCQLNEVGYSVAFDINEGVKEIVLNILEEDK